jgi:hypothetical protein
MARSASTVRHQRRLGVELLTRHGILRGKALVARKIDLRAFQLRFVARELTALLRQRRLIGPRIDLGEQVAFLDLVAFLEHHLDQIAADLGADGDACERCYRSQRIELDPDIALADGFRDDRHRRAAEPAAAASGPRLLFGRCLVPGPPDDAGDQKQHDEGGHDNAAAGARLCRRTLVGGLLWWL